MALSLTLVSLSACLLLFMSLLLLLFFFVSQPKISSASIFEICSEFQPRTLVPRASLIFSFTQFHFFCHVFYFSRRSGRFLNFTLLDDTLVISYSIRVTPVLRIGPVRSLSVQSVAMGGRPKGTLACRIRQ